jgi:hypothetical protein
MHQRPDSSQQRRLMLHTDNSKVRVINYEAIDHVTD